MNETIFRAKGITKKYRKNTALKNVSMEIKQGQIYGFIGQNGAGKTSMIRILTGLAQPTSGEIELFGSSNASVLARQRHRIGCIIESPVLFPDMTARQNLEVLRIQRGIPGRDCVTEALHLVGLTDTGAKQAKNFSLGMRQRLALAMAMLGEPEFLVLDEPTNGLDPTGIIEIRKLLMRLNRERAITILISSHLLSEIHLLATHYGFIHRGELIEQISAKDLDIKCRKFIRIESTQPERVTTIIEHELNTTQYEVLADQAIRLYAFTDTPEKVSKALYKGGAEIKSIMVQGETLETYYSELIGGGDRA